MKFLRNSPKTNILFIFIITCLTFLNLQNKHILLAKEE
jgi:hypothetical protein